MSRSRAVSGRPCCACSRASGTCKSCSCASDGRCCSNCYPGRDNKCTNFGNVNLQTAVVGMGVDESLCSAPPFRPPGWVPHGSRDVLGSVPPPCGSHSRTIATRSSASAVTAGSAPSSGHQSSRDGALGDPQVSVPASASALPRRGMVGHVPSSGPQSSRDRTTGDTHASAPAPAPVSSECLRVDLPPPRCSGGSRPVQSGDGGDHVVAGVAHAPLVAPLWSRHAELAIWMRTAYGQVVCWQRNLFMTPSGSTGKRFVNIIADFINTFASGGPAACVAWECVAVASHLLLQRPEPHSRSKENTEHLQRRMDMWAAGDLQPLLEESRCVQAHLRPRSGSAGGGGDSGMSDTDFAKLVHGGRLGQALSGLSEGRCGKPLRADDIAVQSSGETVRDVLQKKHPAPVDPAEGILLDCEPDLPNQIMFETISAEKIKKTAGRMKSSGSGGPSGLDVAAWQRMLTVFKGASANLASALAAAAKRLCREVVDPQILSAFVAARLVPLEKSAGDAAGATSSIGVRPIAVGEVHRRIIAKAILDCVSTDVVAAVAPFQVCVGMPSACEAAVLAVQSQYLDPETEAILFIDASNAFNAVNRQAALHNVPRVCPAVSTIFQNTYGAPISLFLPGGDRILSREGTCQGDPLAMALFALAISPMIRRLSSDHPSIGQCWYADDGEAGGRMMDVHKFWLALSDIGPEYGYFPNASKTTLLVKPDLERAAVDMFDATGIAIRTGGVRYLGGAVGQSTFIADNLDSHIASWVREMSLLADISLTQPHAAYSAFVRGMKSKWNYHIRSHPGLASSYRPLDDVINNKYIPTLTGRTEVSDSERKLMALPVRYGGLAIPVVSEDAEVQRRISEVVTGPVVRMLRSGSNELTPARIVSDTSVLRRHQNNQRAAMHRTQLSELAPALSGPQRVLLETSRDAGVGSWLTAEPLASCGFVLNKSAFRDAVAIRYGWPLDELPSSCVCGAAMTIDHAAVCPTGGYPSLRHNEIRDLLAEVFSAVISDVRIEPTLLPLTGESLDCATANRSPEARLDICARGFWSRQQDAFFDVRVTHPSASLLSRSDVLAQLSRNEAQKKRAYLQRVIDVERGTFTPLVFATNGMCASECSRALKNIVQLIVEKQPELSYAMVMSHLRCRISFILLRWLITCFRGCRASYCRKRVAISFLDQCRLLQL